MGSAGLAERGPGENLRKPKIGSGRGRQKLAKTGIFQPSTWAAADAEK
jgi:hypothetical protein